MSLDRLHPGDWVAWAAAIALLLFMSVDWYSTASGEEARRIEELTEPSGALGGEIERTVDEEARIVAEGHERNAFQEDGAIDRFMLVVMLGAIGLTFVALVRRAAGKASKPPGTPIAAAAALAALGAALVAYRIVQEPGLDAGTTVKVGAPLGLLALGVMALGARAAARAEQERAKGPREEATA